MKEWRLNIFGCLEEVNFVLDSDVFTSLILKLQIEE